jgi:hypothetical protein
VFLWVSMKAELPVPVSARSLTSLVSSSDEGVGDGTNCGGLLIYGDGSG